MNATFTRQQLLGVVAVLSVGLSAFAYVLGLAALGQAVFTLGVLVVLPLVVVLGDALPVVESAGDAQEFEPTTSDPATGETAQSGVEQLRERYAKGEISDEEFERRLERLLESEQRVEERAADRLVDRE
ncbi:SHOCT domain-containing protein [Haloarcula sp. S1CR25-12]|uniref:SHOCT domain-containing protein n=1 Tax=Haloarcula saliterrae TaxID=2950534 RepID=A0ABU2FC17_9EURY|nr:SHOCT domain-containing protein [Haloarcula sp. S1CR25-12]MDS0259823.1 SHOCT domain-containing protein [Haloarcula sp. S1CR25-12]